MGSSLERGRRVVAVSAWSLIAIYFTIKLYLNVRSMLILTLLSFMVVICATILWYAFRAMASVRRAGRG